MRKRGGGGEDLAKVMAYRLFILLRYSRIVGGVVNKQLTIT